MKYILIATLCVFMCACAPGYTASDVKEGAEEDAQQIEERFDQDVKGTEKMFEDADMDMDDLAKSPAQSSKTGQNKSK